MRVHSTARRTKVSQLQILTVGDDLLGLRRIKVPEEKIELERMFAQHGTRSRRLVLSAPGNGFIILTAADVHAVVSPPVVAFHLLSSYYGRRGKRIKRENGTAGRACLRCSGPV